MVQPNGRPHPPPLHLLAPSRPQPRYPKPRPLPGNPLRSRHGYFLAVHTTVTSCAEYESSPCGTFLFAGDVWIGGFVSG